MRPEVLCQPLALRFWIVDCLSAKKAFGRNANVGTFVLRRVQLRLGCTYKARMYGPD